MGMIESKFNRSDIETLIDSMSDWESLGNQEFHLLNMVKNASMPPEDHENFDMMRDIKEHFLKREREIKENRETRQEKATMLKAKLMLARMDMGIDQLFEMSSDPLIEEDKPEVSKQTAEPEEKLDVVRSDEEPTKIEVSSEKSDTQKKLDRAEYFIRDMGVWGYYEKFLAEKPSE